MWRNNTFAALLLADAVNREQSNDPHVHWSDCSDGHFVLMLFEVKARAHPVPRITSTETASGTKHKLVSRHRRFNRLICQGGVVPLPPLAGGDVCQGGVVPLPPLASGDVCQGGVVPLPPLAGGDVCQGGVVPLPPLASGDA